MTRQNDTMVQTTTRFVEKFPANPVALSFQSLKLLNEGDLLGSLNSLQDALEVTSQEMPQSVYDCIILVGQAMLSNVRFCRPRLLTLAMIISQAKTKLSWTA